MVRRMSPGRKGRAASHPCSGNGHKGIDGDGLDAELLKGKGHIDAVLPSFSHADDAAGANTETRALGGLDGADAVIEGMARADMREKAAAGFNVMMVACDAGRKKAARWSSLKMPWTRRGSIVRSFSWPCRWKALYRNPFP